MRDVLERLSEMVRDTVWELPESFDKSMELGMGADGTPTSNIDKVAEDAILKFVDDNDLPVNVLSEEAGFVDREKAKTLVIDPIDGTHNSILGIPFYSVSLAIGTKSLSDVQEGLVRNLASDDIYYARTNEGAFLNGKRIEVRSYDPRTATFLVYTGRHMKAESIDVIKRSMRSRALGCASLEMCMVAQGKADLQYMNTDVYEKSIRVIDIAASTLILREAGGEVYDMERKRLDMPFDLKSRSNFFAVGDARVLEVLD